MTCEYRESPRMLPRRPEKPRVADTPPWKTTRIGGNDDKDPPAKATSDWRPSTTQVEELRIAAQGQRPRPKAHVRQGTYEEISLQ